MASSNNREHDQVEAVRIRGLKEETKELHHSAEKHPIGESMANGTIRKEWWAEWVAALCIIHEYIDYYNDGSMRRIDELRQDLMELKCPTHSNVAAQKYVESLKDIKDIEAATYVFTGAHLMGGAITAKALNGRLPAKHLEWTDRKETLKHWSPLREKLELKEGANKAFKAVIDILDEILVNHPC